MFTNVFTCVSTFHCPRFKFYPSSAQVVNIKHKYEQVWSFIHFWKTYRRWLQKNNYRKNSRWWRWKVYWLHSSEQISLIESLRISVFTLNKVWKRFCDGFTEKPYSSGGNRNCKLTNEDLELIEVLKNERPSISLAEISNVLTEMGNAASISAISSAIKIKQECRQGSNTPARNLRWLPENVFIKTTFYTSNFLLTIWARRIPAVSNFSMKVE